MKYVKKKLSELKLYENNPRINDEAVDDVVESIKQCSYIAPIIIDEDGVILAGHTIYKALKKLGYKECDGCWIRNIVFNFPVPVQGSEIKSLPLESKSTVEVVCMLVKA